MRVRADHFWSLFGRDAPNNCSSFVPHDVSLLPRCAGDEELWKKIDSDIGWVYIAL
jgi:hypothetical protein